MVQVLRSGLPADRVEQQRFWRASFAVAFQTPVFCVKKKEMVRIGIPWAKLSYDWHRRASVLPPVQHTGCDNSESELLGNTSTGRPGLLGRAAAAAAGLRANRAGALYHGVTDYRAGAPAMRTSPKLEKFYFQTERRRFNDRA